MVKLEWEYCVNCPFCKNGFDIKTTWIPHFDEYKRDYFCNHDSYNPQLIVKFEEFESNLPIPKWCFFKRQEELNE